MLAIQKLKRIVNRTILDRDMVDERFRNREIVSAMTAILQDGGQTVKYGQKSTRDLLKVIILGIQKSKRDGDWTARS